MRKETLEGFCGVAIRDMGIDCATGVCLGIVLDMDRTVEFGDFSRWTTFKGPVALGGKVFVVPIFGFNLFMKLNRLAGFSDKALIGVG